MKILEVVVPVFFFIILGYILKRKNVITDGGVAVMKNLAINVFLPAAAFHVLIHGTFTKNSLVLIGTEIVILFAAYGAGFVYKNLFDRKIAGYVPLAVTTFEGGLFGWSMISILVGSDRLFYIIPMDMINGIFCFTILATNLKILAGQRGSAAETARAIFLNPVILAVAAGTVGCALGWGKMIDSSGYAGVYRKLFQWLREPLIPIVLLCVGSGLVFEKDILARGIKLVACRFCIMSVLCILTLLFLSKTVGLFPALTVSLLTYFFIPPSFLLPMYSNDREVVEFLSGFLSLQIIVSVMIFAILSVLMHSGIFGLV